MRCPLGGTGSSPQEMTTKTTECSGSQSREMGHVLLLISKNGDKRKIGSTCSIGTHDQNMGHHGDCCALLHCTHDSQQGCHQKHPRGAFKMSRSVVRSSVSRAGSGRSPCPSSWPGPRTHAPRGFHLNGATGWRSPQIFRGEPDPPPKILWCLR